MERDKIVDIIMVIIFGIFLQIIFVFGESKDTPNKAAVKFTEAYFKLDKSMSSYLCKNLTSSEEENIIEKFIYRNETEAAERGLTPDFMKSRLFNVETETKSKTDKEVTLKISGERIVAINPVYAVVAKLFHIGKVHRFEDEITMIKEEGRWKVCGKPFSLM